MPLTHQSHKIRSYDRWLNRLLATITVAGLGLWLGMAYLPLDLHLEHLNSQTVGLQLKVDQASKIAHMHQALEDQLAKSEQETAALLLRIPAGPRESDFLSQVCHLAEQFDLEVLDYRPSTIHILDNHREMEVQVNARGEYEPLCRFMEQVGGLPRLCRITQLEIGAPATDKMLTAELVFRIYFSPSHEDAPARKG